ncbi:hypothetical protein F444_05414 [Phytophthora nicotianae P1976]|uniref:BED-type domain-containing protein n=1 Tax=Phytophthora nicotianae P1976 TaxID=1317066 RepID=A0A081ALZ6_PHYNI|nr:hypothetical protein F444_05414 [Phytophthora nicotianae P1976]
MPDRAPIADQRRTTPAAQSTPSAARSARSGTSPFRSPPGSVLRRSPRYSPYRDGISYSSPSSQQLNSPPVTRPITFSPQPRTTTPSRPPHSPAPPLSSRASPLRTGRPRNEIWDNYYIEIWDNYYIEIWDNYYIERENGKKHGRCKYCGTLKKNGKPRGNLLKHLISSRQCPNVLRDVQISLRPKPVATDPLPATDVPSLSNPS